MFLPQQITLSFSLVSTKKKLFLSRTHFGHWWGRDKRYEWS